jgi:hypothetical protein
MFLSCRKTPVSETELLAVPGICNIAQSHRLDAEQVIDENATTMDGRLDAAFRGTVSRRNGR